MGGCLDARDVPECDVDECAFWENSELDQGKTLIISILIITQETYFFTAQKLNCMIFERFLKALKRWKLILSRKYYFLQQLDWYT